MSGITPNVLHYLQNRLQGQPPGLALEARMEEAQRRLETAARRLMEQLAQRQRHVEQLTEELVAATEAIDCTSGAQDELRRQQEAIRTLHATQQQLMQALDNNRRVLADQRANKEQLQEELRRFREFLDAAPPNANERALYECGGSLCRSVAKHTYKG
jgi:DNA repair exonuclease SbcCD ATPase subunit